MSLRDKLIRDMPKLKTALCAGDVAVRYSVSGDTASKTLRLLLKDGLIKLERAGNTYFYRWKT
jgi:DNA-binding transcriptional ArsR family regulator